jgi:hypothetical protein
MHDLVMTLIDLPMFTTGRRRFALAQVQKVAAQVEDTPLSGLLERAIAFEDQALQKEAAWRRSRNPARNRGEAALHDGKNDRLIGAIGRHLDAALALEDDSAQWKAARQLSDSLFPGGVAALTTQVFEEQLASNDQLIAAMRGDLANEVETLGLKRFVDALAESNEAFRAELSKQEKPEISFDELDAARQEGNRLLRRVVARVLGASTEQSPAADKQKLALLAPILDQARRIRAARRGRRPPVDVDPQTGAELPLSDGEPDTPSTE